jgi:HEAT repeat protein
MSALSRIGWTTLVAIALTTTVAARAQQPGTASETVTYQDIIKLLRTGSSEPEILAALSKSTVDVNFILGESQVQELKKMRVSDEFIDAVRNLKNRPGVPGGDVTDFALILDCSGSMLEKTQDGISKMEAAKKTVTQLIQRIPAGMRLTFVIYGHDKQLECQAVKVVQSLTELDDATRANLIKFVAALQPSGHTPIAAALQAVGKELANASGLAEVALITDGVETCHGDPAKEAAQLAATLKLKSGINVIGLGMKPEERKAVEKIAQAGRGKYYDARTADELRRSLTTVSHVALQTEPTAPADDKIPAAVQALIEQLTDTDADVRHAAAESLGKMGARAKGAVPAIVSRIADDLWGSQGQPVNKDNATGNTSKDAALKALKQLAPDRVEEALLAAMKSKNSKTKQWATTQLGASNAASSSGRTSSASDKGGSVDASPTVRALIAQLSDEDADVRHAAATSLAKLGAAAKGAVPALIERLADDRWGSKDKPVNTDNSTGNTSKDAALKALRQLAPDNVESALVAAMKSSNPKVKTWAAKALAEVSR